MWKTYTTPDVLKKDKGAPYGKMQSHSLEAPAAPPGGGVEGRRGGPKTDHPAYLTPTPLILSPCGTTGYPPLISLTESLLYATPRPAALRTPLSPWDVSSEEDRMAV